MFLRLRLKSPIDFSVSCFPIIVLSWLVSVSNVNGDVQKLAKPEIPAVMLHMGLTLPVLINGYLLKKKSVNFYFNRNLMLLLLLTKIWVLQSEVLS